MRRKITIELDRTREMSFSWAAIDYLLEKYDDISVPLGLVAGITDSAASITKDRLDAFFHLMTALFKADDPKITPKHVKELMPFDRMAEFIIQASMAIEAGQAPGNPQTPTE